MANKPFGINVKFVVKPERRDEFLTVMQQNQKQTLQEGPYALQFVLGEDFDTPNVFYLHEEWQTQADHRTKHSKTKHYKDCTEFFATEPFVEPHQADEFYLAHDPPVSQLPNHPYTFCLNVELNIRPELREEFLQVIQNNKCGSDNDEPLCLQYSYGESIDSPNTFYFHEQYAGNRDGLEGFEVHQAAPHFQVWEDFASKEPSPFTKPPMVQKYKTIFVEQK